jgi:hypothetical protein
MNQDWCDAHSLSGVAVYQTAKTDMSFRAMSRGMDVGTLPEFLRIKGGDAPVRTSVLVVTVAVRIYLTRQYGSVTSAE